MIDFVIDLVEEHVWVVLNFLNQFSNAGTLRMLHNGMWWSWNSEVHVRLVLHYCANFRLRCDRIDDSGGSTQRHDDVDRCAKMT